ncbi:MAG: alkaline phosphatase family protein [Nanoarchaeota archaeon]|nr:alkaline phosphatase family protein [Nanoarchaeota archaeon]
MLPLEKKLLSRTIAPGLLMPSYEGYCIANIMASILQQFGAKQQGTPLADGLLPEDATEAEKVVLFVADGLGYDQLQTEIARRNAPGLKSFAGSVIPLTACAPTATTANLCSFVTGVPPGIHGFLGYKSELLLRSLDPAAFKLGPGGAGQRLADIDLHAADIREVPLATQLLMDAGIQVVQYNRRDYLRTPLSEILYTNMKVHDYVDREDLLVHARKHLMTTKGKLFAWLYWDMIDGISHVHGALSDFHAAEVRALDAGIITELLEPLEGSNTLFIFTADHGHINRNEERVVDLTEDAGLMKLLQFAPQGDVREGRLNFFYTKKGKANATLQHLQQHYSQDSIAMLSDDALKLGLFGTTKMTPTVRKRIGDVVMIAKDDALLGSRPIEEMLRLYGYHGGLTRQEVLVPFIAKVL